MRANDRTPASDLDAGARPAMSKVIAAFAAIYVIWGSTYLAIRYGVESMPPFLMAGSRFLFAGALLYVFARARGGGRPEARHWRDATVAGVLMIMIGNGGVTWAEQVIPSGVAALLVALVPLWMVLVDWMRPRGRRPGAVVMLGLAIGFAGVALLAGSKGQHSGSAHHWSVIVLLLSSVGWAIGSVFNQHAQKPASPLLAIGMQMISGGIALLVIAIARGEILTFNPATVSAKSVYAWLYLTIFGSLIGFPAYIWLLRVSSPARVSTYAYVNPLVAVVLGGTLGREAWSSELFAAGGLIILAVILIVCPDSWKARLMFRKPAGTLLPPETGNT